MKVVPNISKRSKDGRSALQKYKNKTQKRNIQLKEPLDFVSFGGKSIKKLQKKINF